MYTGHQDAQWRPFFQAVERRLGEQAFETWFRPLRLQRNVDDRVLRIAAPNDVVRDWILSKYADTLEQSLNESHMGALRIEWATDPKTTATTSPEVSSVGPEQTSSRQIAPPTEDVLPEDGNVNEKYNFPNFVVASCNRVAHAAAMAVADSTGKTYNPLYLYGGVG